MITQQESTIILQGISLSEFLLQVKKVTSPESNSSPEAVFDADEAAEFCNVSTATIWRKKLKGEIPYTQLGGRVVFLRSQLIAWLTSKSTNPKVHTR